MFVLPTGLLAAKYVEMANAFIEQVNNNLIVLYKAVDPTMTDAPAVDNPFSITRYGGRQPIDDFHLRTNESGSAKIESPATIEIYARTYWNRKKFDPNSYSEGVIVPKNNCKIITYEYNQQALLEADYAIINSTKCKMIKNPAPHGLFGKQYISAEFEEITGG